MVRDFRTASRKNTLISDEQRRVSPPACVLLSRAAISSPLASRKAIKSESEEKDAARAKRIAHLKQLLMNERGAHTMMTQMMADAHERAEHADARAQATLAGRALELVGRALGGLGKRVTFAAFRTWKWNTLAVRATLHRAVLRAVRRKVPCGVECVYVCVCVSHDGETHTHWRDVGSESRADAIPLPAIVPERNDDDDNDDARRRRELAAGWETWIVFARTGYERERALRWPLARFARRRLAAGLRKWTVVTLTEAAIEHARVKFGRSLRPRRGLLP